MILRLHVLRPSLMSRYVGNLVLVTRVLVCCSCDFIFTSGCSSILDVVEVLVPAALVF